jgi:hypothetical protein
MIRLPPTKFKRASLGIIINGIITNRKSRSITAGEHLSDEATKASSFQRIGPLHLDRRYRNENYYPNILMHFSKINVVFISALRDIMFWHKVHLFAFTQLLYYYVTLIWETKNDDNLYLIICYYQRNLFSCWSVDGRHLALLTCEEL